MAEEVAVRLVRSDRSGFGYNDKGYPGWQWRREGEWWGMTRWWGSRIAQLLAVSVR